MYEQKDRDDDLYDRIPEKRLSWYDTLDNINESRVKLLKILRKYLGKISYFWVIEPHTKNNTGYPHIHLVVFKYVDNEIKDSNGEGMEDKLRRLYSEEWGTGSHTYGLDFQQMKGEHDIEDLKNYLMKYISKVTSMTNHGARVSLSLMRTCTGRHMEQGRQKQEKYRTSKATIRRNIG